MLEQIWDVASGRLKLTLTGHIEQIRGWSLMNYWWYTKFCWLTMLWIMTILISYWHGKKNVFLIVGLAVSSKHTYMFSAGDDKQVKCWDLEQNKVRTFMQFKCSILYCISNSGCEARFNCSSGHPVLSWSSKRCLLFSSSSHNWRFADRGTWFCLPGMQFFSTTKNTFCHIITAALF